MKKLFKTFIALAFLGFILDFLGITDPKPNTVVSTKQTVEKTVVSEPAPTPKPKKLTFDDKLALVDTDEQKAYLILDKVELTTPTVCKQLAKKTATNPRTVDYDWGYGPIKKFYDKHNNIAKVEVYITGEAQNNFGAMRDFNPTCMFKIDVSKINKERDVNSFISVDYIYVNGKKVYKS